MDDLQIGRIYAVLPIFNEADNLSGLLRELHFSVTESMPHRHLIVVAVDDGSTDHSVDVLLEFQERVAECDNLSVELVRHEENRGLADAIRTGLVYCVDRTRGRDIVLTMDSDNSHAPGLVPRMVRLIQEGHDLVIASRYQRGSRVIGLSWSRQMLSLGASFLLRAIFPIPGVRDYTCGFRTYRASLLMRAFKSNPQFISERGFTVMVDILLKLRLLEPRVLMTEVPLLLRYDRKQGASKMKVGRTVRETLALICRRRLGQP